MPFVDPRQEGSRKRSREEDWDHMGGQCLYSPPERSTDFYFPSYQPHALRKIHSLSKRARRSEDYTNTTAEQAALKKQASQQSLYQQPHLSSYDLKTPAAKNLALQPCHICHSRPTRKSHLENYARCEGCGQQACFICLRQCHGLNSDDEMMLSEQEVLSRSFGMTDGDKEMDGNDNRKDVSTNAVQKGWDAGGHRSKVCSRCCVERGANGEVICLGCLPRLDGA